MMSPTAQDMAVNFISNVVAPWFDLQVAPDWQLVTWKHQRFLISVFLEGLVWRFSFEEDGVSSGPQDFEPGRLIWTIQGLVDNYRNVKRF
jgi:hypothetical protein